MKRAREHLFNFKWIQTLYKFVLLLLSLPILQSIHGQMLFQRHIMLVRSGGRFIVIVIYLIIMTVEYNCFNKFDKPTEMFISPWLFCLLFLWFSFVCSWHCCAIWRQHDGIAGRFSKSYCCRYQESIFSARKVGIIKGLFLGCATGIMTLGNYSMFGIANWYGTSLIGSGVSGSSVVFVSIKLLSFTFILFYWYALYFLA